MQIDKQEGQKGTNMAKGAFFRPFCPLLSLLLLFIASLWGRGICQVSCQEKASNNDFAKAPSG
jgi:hypothetical protein